QPDVAGSRAFLRFFRRELHALAFAQQLEHCAADRAAVEEVLDAAFVADESEALVNQQPCNCPGWHTRSPPSARTPKGTPWDSPGQRASEGYAVGTTETPPAEPTPAVSSAGISRQSRQLYAPKSREERTFDDGPVATCHGSSSSSSSQSFSSSSSSSSS